MLNSELQTQLSALDAGTEVQIFDTGCNEYIPVSIVTDSINPNGTVVIGIVPLNDIERGLYYSK